MSPEASPATATGHPGACGEADVVLNLAGVNPLRSWVEAVPHRVLVDKDPVFTMLRHRIDPVARERAAAHTAFFTFGENISSLPDDGFPWQPTRHPIQLDQWPAVASAGNGMLTTVMQWESYSAIESDGRRYGRKAESFAPYLSLPHRVGRRFELTIGGPNVPRELLESHGWRLRDPRESTPDPWCYRSYIQESRAEFGIAKEGYASTGCGWFSERSASYLASGRPVVVQDTGFSTVIPVGAGVLAFSTPDEATAAIDDLERSYAVHSAAARELAESHFDARIVLSSLLERVLGAST